MPRSVIAVPRTAAGNRQLIRDFGTCLNFAGGSATDNVEFPDTASLDITTTFTFSAWIKPGSYGPSGVGVILFKADSALSNGWSFRLNSATKSLRFQASGGTDVTSTANGLQVLGQWYHVAVSFDSSAGSNEIKFYINGIASGTASRSSAVATNSNSLTIGNNTIGTVNRAFEGKIDEVKIYNRTLTATEIQNEYIGVSQSTSGLVLYTKFDEGNGTSATDSSGTQSAGTITGATYSTDVFIKPRFLTRDFGTCLNFGANATDKATFTMPSTFNGTAFTLAAWVNPAAIFNTAGDRIFDGTVAGGGFTILLDQANSSLSAQVNHTVANAITRVPISSLKKGVWQRVLFTWSDADNTPNVYVNGSLVTPSATTNKSGTRNSVTGSTAYIANNSADTRSYKGKLDEICYWDRVLTTQEIADDYYTSISPSSLVLRYKMDEGSGTSLTDSGSSGTTGTITGATYSTDVFIKPRTAA